MQEVLSLADNADQGTDEDGEIGEVENDPVLPGPWSGKGKIIHNIGSFQTVVGIGKSTSQK